MQIIRNISKIIEINDINSQEKRVGVITKIASELGFEKYENHPDILIIEQEEKQSIGIEQTSQIMNWAFTRPFQSPNKIIFIMNADILTIESQNNLLKIAEEPPVFTHIYFIVENHKNLLETIISRSLVINNREEKQSKLSEHAENFLHSGHIEKVLLVDTLAKLTSKELMLFLDEIMSALRENNIQLHFKTIEKLFEFKKLVKQNVNKKLILMNLVMSLGDFTF